MTLLLIDTSFDTCQAGLWRDGALLASSALTGEARHDVMLAPLVAQLLSEQNMTVRDLSGVAVMTGPGRFTSLRVGIAFARALVLPHKIPLVGIATGQVMQLLVTGDTPAWLVMVKRGEVFAQTPDLAEPVNLTFDALPDWLAQHTIKNLAVMGAGVPTDWEMILPTALKHKVFPFLPLETIGQVASRELNQTIIHPRPVRPYYGTSTGAWLTNN